MLEGGEWVGKTTQIKKLEAALRERVSVETAREPGGTPLGEKIRELLLHSDVRDLSSGVELFLMLAARAALVQRVKRALHAGRWVLLDRYYLSTLAYQGLARRLGRRKVEMVNELATGGLEPDLWLILDVPVEEAMERGRLGRKTPDRIESESLCFLREVREGYLKLGKELARARILDARGSREEVARLIVDAVRGRFPELAVEGKAPAQSAPEARAPGDSANELRVPVAG